MFCSNVPSTRYGVIYLITHKENGKQYVGQTVGSYQRRWNRHCCGKNKGVSVIGLAIDKYGSAAFDVEEFDWAESKEELDRKERFWIAFLDTLSPSGYNLKDGGANGKMHPDSIIKISIRQRNRKLPDTHPFKQKGRKPWYKPHKRTPEQNEANRQRALAYYAQGNPHPMLGRKMSPERMEANREYARRPRPSRRYPIKCVETNEIFLGAQAAIDAFIVKGVKLTKPGICHVLDDPKHTAGGYHWVSVK